jgi:hypothetical protein
MVVVSEMLVKISYKNVKSIEKLVQIQFEF